MSIKLQDRSGVKQWILRKLGGPLVCVELSNSQIEDAINDGLQWFVGKKGIQAVRQIRLNAGQTEYKFDEDVDEIEEVIFAENPLDFSTLFSPVPLIDKVPYDLFANPRGGGMYSSFTQALQYIEQAKRITSSEPEWKVIHRTLFVFRVDAAIEAGANVAVLIYKPTSIDLEDLKVRDHDMVRHFALAEAKITLGNVRGKYDRYPTAQGTVVLNAVSLLEQGEKEKDSLEEQISNSAGPMGWLTG